MSKQLDSPEGTAKSWRPTVLLVDDEPALLKLMTSKLRSLGWEVHATPRAAEALEIADRLSCRLNLLVTDIQMPEMRGDALIRQIRMACPFIDVVAITGALPQGAYLPNVPFLKKPFSMEQLVGVANDILSAQL